MTQETEIQVLSKIQYLINNPCYEDEDDFSIALARAFMKNRDKNFFLKEADRIKTSFFKKNRVGKSLFLSDVFEELSKLKLYETYSKFPKQIYVEDIDAFSKLKDTSRSSVEYVNALEKDIKKVFRSVIGESYDQKDWGGEYCDLFSSARLNGKRIPVAMAYKGRGKKGVLQIGDMGTNGDQIDRLFKEPAILFILQYVGPISSAVYTSMATYAYTKSGGGKEEIYYCLITGSDTDAIIKTYGGK